MRATALPIDAAAPVRPGSRTRGRMLAVASARAVRRARSGWLFALFGAVAVIEIIQTATAFLGNESLLWFHQDFPALYAAGKMVASGSGSLLYDTAALGDAEVAAAGHPVGGTGVLAYFNPPFFAAMLSPLSALPLDRAYQAWTLFNLCLLLLEGLLLWRIAAPLSKRWRIALLAGSATLYPVSYGLQLGQFSLVLVTSWTAAYLLLRARRDAWAGVALAPLLIKPELLVPVAAYLLWKRRWRVVSTLGPLIVAAVIASVAIVGRQSALAYPGFLLDSTKWHGDGVATNVMFDWNGIAAMWWERPAASHAGLIAVLALSLATLAGLAHACRARRDAASLGFPRQWALLTLATVLVDPHLYLQDTVLVVPAAAVLLASACAHRRTIIAVAMLGGWSLLGFGIYPNEHLHVNAFGLYLALACVMLLASGPMRIASCAGCQSSGDEARPLGRSERAAAHS